MWWSGILNGNNNPLPVFHVASSGCCWEALCVYVWAVGSLHSSGLGPEMEHDRNSQLRVKCSERGKKCPRRSSVSLCRESKGGGRYRHWWAWLLSTVALPVFQTLALVECPQAAAQCPWKHGSDETVKQKLQAAFGLIILNSLCKDLGLIFFSCSNQSGSKTCLRPTLKNIELWFSSYSSQGLEWKGFCGRLVMTRRWMFPQIPNPLDIIYSFTNPSENETN